MKSKIKKSSQHARVPVGTKTMALGINSGEYWSSLLGVHIENLKAFRGEHAIYFSPLSILTGKNSAGKSTILQSLMLLKQSLEATDAASQFVFDEIVRLGSFEKALCDSAKPSNKRIRIGIDLNLAKLDASHFGEDVSDAEFAHIAFTLTRRKQKRNQFGTAFLERLDYSIYTDKGLKPIISFEVDDIDRRLYYPRFHTTLRKKIWNQAVSTWHPRPPKTPKKGYSVAFNGILPLGVVNDKNVLRSTTSHLFAAASIPMDFLDQFVTFCTFVLRTELGRDLAYLGPLRAEPEEIYPQTVRRIGPKGENAFQFLRANSKLLVKRGLPDGQDADLQTCLDAWVKYLNLAEKLELVSHAEDYFEVLVDGHDLQNVGCGVGQFLPVLIQCLAAPVGTNVLLEQPELHLHQSMQAEIVDFFISQMKRGLRLVIETHSELFIQRLRRRIAEDKNDLHKVVRVYFINSEDPMVTNISISPDGNVKEWPPYFFDQSIREMRVLAEIQAKSAKNKQGS